MIVGYFILCCCVVHINSQQSDGFILLPFPDADVQVLLDECEDHFICVIGDNPDNLIVGCINKTRLCDGRQDCVSGIDERSCPLSCNFGEYKCISSTHICIPPEQMCDGISDCPENDDESFCGTTCPRNYFTCIDGKCVHASKRCDGRIDCVDNSDEAFCAQMGCSGNQFRCRDGVCINANQLCDGLQHCSANEDELICEPRGCTANQFACDDGKCIAATQVCDGEQNCINNEDETICPRKGCERNQLTCFDKCVNASSLCNGVVDCPNGADESDCSLPVLVVNGEYTDWSAWGTCSETCDMGTQTRTRTCTNPAPQFGGLDCMGPAMEQQMCQIIPCPINGGYTDWSAWGTCSETCDMGTQTRTRTCTNPAPQFGGLNCMGPAMEQQMCQIIPCPPATDCPMTLPDVGGVVYPVVTDFSVGVTVDYDCTTICGFTALSGGTIECQADLTWSLPSCSGNIPVGAPGCVDVYGPNTCGGFTSAGRFYIGGTPTNGCWCDFACCNLRDCCYDVSCPFL